MALHIEGKKVHRYLLSRDQSQGRIATLMTPSRVVRKACSFGNLIKREGMRQERLKSNLP